MSAICGSIACLLHQFPTGKEVEELVCASDLDVRPDRDRVVGLRDRVEELVK